MCLGRFFLALAGREDGSAAGPLERGFRGVSGGFSGGVGRQGVILGALLELELEKANLDKRPPNDGGGFCG